MQLLSDQTEFPFEQFVTDSHVTRLAGPGLRPIELSDGRLVAVTHPGLSMKSVLPVPYGTSTCLPLSSLSTRVLARATGGAR
ncbi:hypothetical protein J6590_032806 [Homalodisca vitripennis]|nr:hypothetical protein J6590_032806 [Homalodisca vitripennis]